MADFMAVSIDGFGDAVSQMVSDHIKMTREEIKKNVQKAGKAGAEALRASSPKLTGAYASGWKSRTEDAGLDSFAATVYNSTKPSLSHLLEFGHGLVYYGHPTGRRVPPYPHMDAGYDAGAAVLGG